MGHENRVSCLGVSNDGISLCTGSWDSLVSLPSTPRPGVDFANRDSPTTAQGLGLLIRVCLMLIRPVLLWIPDLTPMRRFEKTTRVLFLF